MKCSSTLSSLVAAYGLLALGGLSWSESTTHTVTPDGVDVYSVEKSVTRETRLDKARRAAGSRVASAARWADHFFEDPDFLDEEAHAHISLRQSVEFSRKSDVEYRTRINGSVSLPHFSRKLKVVFEGDDDLEIDEEDDPDDMGTSTDQSVEAHTVGLQYAALSRPDYDFRIGVGVRMGDTAVFAGPRWRVQANVSPMWRTRFTQRLRWYSDDGWKSSTDVDVDRQIGPRNLFRQNVSTVWREDRFDRDGFRHTATSSFVQPLADLRAIRYAWSSDYLTRPDQRWSSSTLSVSYRSSLFRDWIRLELKPFVSWEEDFEWNANPGVVISLSCIIEDDKRPSPPPVQ